MVNIDGDAINCHGHCRRPHVGRVFMKRPGHLTCRDADVLVRVFLTPISEFFRLLCDCMLAVRVL